MKDEIEEEFQNEVIPDLKKFYKQKLSYPCENCVDRHVCIIDVDYRLRCKRLDDYLAFKWLDSKGEIFYK